MPLWKFTTSGASNAHSWRRPPTFAVVISARGEYRSPASGPLYIGQSPEGAAACAACSWPLFTSCLAHALARTDSARAATADIFIRMESASSLDCATTGDSDRFIVVVSEWQFSREFQDWA